ncbi:DUF2784 domain-containing protein [Glaciimonas sp. PAMC28666]|uniref:DUF2784 domain-containing protein n=1 Tax=Glaciimonas sp. PAMC28666 TaxID=2807626 RepID=UPI001963893E|nr:DUF2784 domain-containing protein [Glaciimonas sp. PAMC28666]QRX82016.1 DUF2784 domain-containing protein [Glaciimonas sp. PAMC28666]
MLYRLSADAVLLLHITFIAFVLLGAALATRWRWIIAAHLPAAAWGFFVELSGRICPLTVVENFLRAKAGESGYAGGFVEHYFVPMIYPAGLSRDIQLVLAGVVLIANFAIYGWLFIARRAPR